ncbi:1-deoxy-D-xylulose 5-phosphate reductoisomerase [Striga asiatica]|uniref:1-deoxy-D-xylulose 5-phosphate reductoisomerase n=1 Tax=Striga asiatica TaxID=4170 RepID=A0A5A7NVU7_STRAF|nr:1-deoxy-D-xylulose 5-phosphate reductoisomerase [Striga asiatica]
MGRHDQLLQYVVVSLVALAAVLGRDLRPSDHGLAYQEASPLPPPEDGDEREMRSFFGGTASPSVELPEAKNISDTWWSERGGSGAGAARDAGRDRVRLGLVVASGVCGLTGVLLMVVSGVVFMSRLHKKKVKAAGELSTSAAGNSG